MYVCGDKVAYPAGAILIYVGTQVACLSCFL